VLWPAHPLVCTSELLRLPFFRRYGVILPSSLTEGRSFTSGGFPRPTCVGLRYGRAQSWLVAFLGGLGVRRLPSGSPDSCQSSRLL
jgi:hypothetical protein